MFCDTGYPKMASQKRRIRLFKASAQGLLITQTNSAEVKAKLIICSVRLVISNSWKQRGCTRLGLQTLRPTLDSANWGYVRMLVTTERTRGTYTLINDRVTYLGSKATSMPSYRGQKCSASRWKFEIRVGDSRVRRTFWSSFPL